MGVGNATFIPSMTTTRTEDRKGTIRQILSLEQAGCDRIRCAVPTMEDAKTMKEIKKQIHIPLVADIHFDSKLAIEFIRQSADKIRINPDNIGSIKWIKAVVEEAKKYAFSKSIETSVRKIYNHPFPYHKRLQNRITYHPLNT